MSSPHFNPEATPRAAATLPATMELGGHEVVVAYSDVAVEFAALRTGAIVIDRSFRGRMRFFGEKSGEALTGLVTSDVIGTLPGHGHYAAALSAKGRIVADLRIFATPVASSYLVDTPPRAWPGFLAMVKKYVNPRVSGYRDDSHAIRDIGIFGADARRIVSRLTGVAADTLGGLAPFDNVTATVHGAEVLIARVPDLGLEGYDLFVPFEIFDSAWRDAVAAGAVPAGLAAWEIARVEAGRPEWGIDMDESTIPQEANFDELDAISYTKGCYIGQEVVARVHFRGHVNRHLRGLRSAGSPPPTGAQLIDDTGNHVGDVRSAVSSPRLGGIAIGMVRREVSPGASLTARSEHGEQQVDVAALPFSA
ncbi:MAG TPA: glycine cleavage T C-terminal barrel domain-containing protein [Gemmatimonadaceae bacterium]|jgi:folate-binding protein YgfZ|nr:glycine cleavage T C-terminal barrel domain-containing protein [Gemmatimonadaceae bacterium]